MKTSPVSLVGEKRNWIMLGDDDMERRLFRRVAGICAGNWREQKETPPVGGVSELWGQRQNSDPGLSGQGCLASCRPYHP